MTAYVEWYGKARYQSWTTPQILFDRLQDEYQFDLDGAATAENAKLPVFQDDAGGWEGHRVFCNPPWSNIRPFVELAATADLAVLLVPSRVNSKWFHRALELGAEVRYFLGRPKFGEAQSNSPVDCMLLVFGE